MVTIDAPRIMSRNPRGFLVRGVWIITAMRTSGPVLNHYPVLLTATAAAAVPRLSLALTASSDVLPVETTSGRFGKTEAKSHRAVLCCVTRQLLNLDLLIG